MPGARSVAVVLSLASAFVWATYYILVLAATPGAAPSAVMFYPFLFGSAAYAVWSGVRGAGRTLLDLWRSPGAYLRGALLVGMQLSVLASTYLAGPVDASLLALIGDVVVTPLVVLALVGGYRTRVTAALFLTGLVLSLAGGTMTIAGGQSLTAVRGLGWLVVPAVPITVAFYFLLTAQENRRAPPSAVVAHSMFVAAVFTLALAPVLPGGWPALATASPNALVLLFAVGVTTFFLGPVLYFGAIARAGMVLPPMLMTGIPVFTLLLSSALLGLTLPLIAALGIPVAVGGAVLTLAGERGPPSPAVEPPAPAR